MATDNPSVIPTTACPYCGYRMNRSTTAIGPNCAPKPGDITLCIDCGEIGQFTGENDTISGMAKLTPGEQFTLFMQQPEAAHVAALARKIKAQRWKKP